LTIEAKIVTELPTENVRVIWLVTDVYPDLEYVKMTNDPNKSNLMSFDSKKKESLKIQFF